MARTRPLSPHLQVYRPQMTSVMSILHRAAGVVLTTGTLIMAAWLVSLALGKEAYDVVVMVIGHPLGQFVLFGYSVALIYHALNGVRHLGMGFGFWPYHSAGLQKRPDCAVSDGCADHGPLVRCLDVRAN